MDSIRPDDDELRAREPVAGKGSEPKRKPVVAENRDAAGGKGRPRDPGRQSEAPRGPGAGLVGLLVALLVIVTAGGGWLGWQMQQKLAVMENQLEEADYWARQSKLALARFEGELTETGENLAETGSSVDERLKGIDTTLKTANDEIRKLWVLANEKNRPRIEALAEQQQALTGQFDTLTAQVTSAGQTLASVGDELEQAVERIGQVGQQQQTLASTVETLAPRIDQVDRQLGTLAGSVNGIEEKTGQQLTRFRQEQALTIEGLESRIQALESANGQVPELTRQLSATRSRLARAEETLASVDASRAQLTARLVRLQEQVDQLRSQ